MNKLRKCIDCQKDISDRHNRCIRCEICQKKADIINMSKRSRRKYVKKHPETTNRTARKKITIGRVRNPGTGNLNGQDFNCGVNKNGEYPTRKLPYPYMRFGKVWNPETGEFTNEDKKSMEHKKILCGKCAEDEMLVWNWSESKKAEYERITAKYAHPSARPKSDKNGYKYWKYYTDVKDKDYIEHWEEYLKRKASNNRIQHVESQRVLRQRRKANKEKKMKGKPLYSEKYLKELEKKARLQVPQKNKRKVKKKNDDDYRKGESIETIGAGDNDNYNDMDDW
jgi:hypothetical protein